MNFKLQLHTIIVLLGVTTITTQIILLRQFLVVGYGNELVIGILLANWMFLTGLGAWLGKFPKRLTSISVMVIPAQILMSILPIITVFLLFVLKNRWFPVGKLLSVHEIFFYSLITLLPFCLISGLLFTFLSSLISEYKSENRVGKVYGLESLGGILGGFAFNFILVFYFSDMQSLAILLVVNMFAAFYLSFAFQRVWRIVIILLTAVLIFLVIRIDLDTVSAQLIFSDQVVVTQKNTPYGNLSVTQTGDQYNFYENGLALFSTDNDIYREESVHFGMLQHDSPKSVLIISGGLSGMIDEINKYDVEKIDWLELNPGLIELGKEFVGISEHMGLRIINEDARLFIKKTDRKYDVILINLPIPITAHINRYYTTEFFNELKEVLNQGGVVSTSLASTGNYMSDESLRLSTVIYNTLNQEFQNVLIIPANRDYYLASDHELTLEVVKKVSEKGLDNEFFNEFYLKDKILRYRSEHLMRILMNNNVLNEDYKPVVYLQQLILWLSYFRINYKVPLIVFAVVLLLFLTLIKPVNLGMFTTGFTASSIEFILLIAFQTLYGYIFRMTGVIIMVFMAGLALGALYFGRRIKSVNMKNYIRIIVAVATFTLIMPLVLYLMQGTDLHGMVYKAVFVMLTLLISTLVGIQFYMGSKLHAGEVGEVAGKLYSADLIGSALGILMISAFFLPMFGVLNVCFFLVGLNILSIIIILVRIKLKGS